MNLVPENINEAIKHLAPYTDAEVREKLAQKIRQLYDFLRNNKDINYEMHLEDDDTCIVMEQNGEMKFRIYLFPQFAHTIDFSIYVYSNNHFKSAYGAGNPDEILAVIKRAEERYDI